MCIVSDNFAKNLTTCYSVLYTRCRMQARHGSARMTMQTKYTKKDDIDI